MSGLEKQKIVVSTIIDSFNYGTAVQAVATRDVLEHYGRPIFIDYYRPQWTPAGHRRMYVERSGNPLVNRAKYLATLGSWNRQRKMFREFLERELVLCDAGPYLNGGQFDPNAVYCVGSDQTWNFEDNKGLDPVYSLINVPDECKKISLSASFGRQALGEKEAELTKKALRGFDAISVRESSSVAILESLGLEGIALKDPVLLCNPDLWQKMAAGVPAQRDPYVLVYRLNENPRMVELAQEVAGELGCNVKLITFNPRQSLRLGHGLEAVCQPIPSEWLGLFRDASYVVTDSFHGTCFSLLFEKPMTVFDPPKYSVRLADVLRGFGLSDRRVQGETGAGETAIHEEPVDWENVRSLKMRFRREAKEFLDGCIGGGRA